MCASTNAASVYLLLACCKNRDTYCFCCGVVSAPRKKSDILQIRTTTKRNDFSCHACVSNQSSSCSESKLTEWCHNASPRALPGCLAPRSLSHSNTGVLSPQLWCSDPVCSHFRAFHRWCLSGGHVHFWRDAGFSFLSQAGCSQ